MFEQLVKFKNANHHPTPDGLHKTDGGIYGKHFQNLGFWCDQMRQYEKSNQSFLTELRIEKLNRLGFLWDSSDLKSSEVRQNRNLTEQVKK